MAPPKYLYLADWMRFKRVGDAELAQRLGVERVTVTRYRNGRRNLTGDKIKDVADQLGIRPEDLWHTPNVNTMARRPIESIGDEGVQVSIDEVVAQNPVAADAIRGALAKLPRGEIWLLKTHLLEGAGYLPGDWLVAAVGAAARPGAVVQALLTEGESRGRHLFRVFFPPRLIPVIFPTSVLPDGVRPEEIVDDQRIIVRAVVVMRVR